MPENIYLSGPCRSMEQLHEMETLASLIHNTTEHKVYWPHAETLPISKNASIDDRKIAFEERMVAILHSTIVIGWLDYLLPEGSELRVLRSPTVAHPCVNHPKQDSPLREMIALEKAGTMKQCNCILAGAVGSAPLHLPDAGTVYEMAVAHALGIKTVGWSVYGRGMSSCRTDLMLATGLDAIIYRREDLKQFLSCGAPNNTTLDWGKAKKYTGKIL